MSLELGKQPDVMEMHHETRVADMGPRTLEYAENIHRQIQEIYDTFDVRDIAGLTVAAQRDPRQAAVMQPAIDRLLKLYAALETTLRSAEKVERVLTSREKLEQYVGFAKRAIGLQEWSHEILRSTRTLHALMPLSPEEAQMQLDRVVDIAEHRGDAYQSTHDYLDLMYTAHEMQLDAEVYLRKALEYIPRLERSQRAGEYATAAAYAAECALPYEDLVKDLRRKGKKGPPFSGDIAHHIARIGTITNDERLIDEAVSSMELTDDAVDAFTTSRAPSAARKLAYLITDPFMRAKGLALAGLSARDIPEEDALHIFADAEEAVMRIEDPEQRKVAMADVASEKRSFLRWNTMVARPKPAYGEYLYEDIADFDVALAEAKQEKDPNHAMQAFRRIIAVMLARKMDPTPVLTAASRKFRDKYPFWNAEVVGVYAIIGKLERAKRIVTRMRGSYRIEALANIDASLLKNGASPDTVFTDQLISEARALPPKERPDGTLHTIARLMADAGLLDRAKALAESIADDAQRSMALERVAVRMAQRGDVDPAFALIEQGDLHARDVVGILLSEVERLKNTMNEESKDLTLV